MSTYDNTARITSLVKPDGDQPTRGEVVETLLPALDEIITFVNNTRIEYAESGDVAALYTAARALANHIVVQSLPLLAAVVVHDETEDRIDALVAELEVTVPDTAEALAE